MSKTQNRYETEQACSPQNSTSMFMNRSSVCILSLFTHIELKVPSGSILTTRANPVFKSSTSNWRFSRAAFPNRTECLSVERHWSKSSVQIKTQIQTVCHRIKRACSSSKLEGSLSLWLYPSYRTESSIEQRYIAKLLIFYKYSGNWRTVLLEPGVVNR